MTRGPVRQPDFDPERFRQQFLEHQNDFGVQLAPNMVNIAGHPLGTENQHSYYAVHVGEEGAPDVGYKPHGGRQDLTFEIPHGETGYRTQVRLGHDLEDNPWGKKGRQFRLWTGMPSQEHPSGWLDKHPHAGPSTDKLARNFSVYPFEVVHGAFQGPEHLLQAIMERGQSFDDRVRSGQMPSMQSRVAEIEKSMYGPVENAWHKVPQSGAAANLDKLKRESQSSNRVAPEKAATGEWFSYTPRKSPEGMVHTTGSFNARKDWQYEPELTLNNKDWDLS